MNKTRCKWAKTPIEAAYHDTEWGVPVHDERALFEFLVLEGAQAGLSWLTILQKRERYREVFDYFDVNKVALYDANKVATLLADSGIVRNRLKVAAAINNAQRFLQVQTEFGSFDAYLWRFVDDKPLVNQWQLHAELPAQSLISQALSNDLIQRGFTFVGPTICYALMQAVGMVNDHAVDCYRHAELSQTKPHKPLNN